MQVSLHLDKSSYLSKPNKKEIQKINQNIIENKIIITPNELAEKLSKGHTVLTSVMSGSRKLENFKSCQVLMLDFDNTVKVNQQKQKIHDAEYLSFEDICQHSFIKNNASFVYKTFNFSESIHKFRVVFVLSEKITTIQDLTVAYQSLFKLFPTADKACKDASRLFFGGFSYTEINFNNVLQTESLLQYRNVAEVPIEEAVEPINVSNVAEITDELKQQLDLTSNQTTITTYYQTKNMELLSRYFEEMHIRIDSSVEDAKIFHTRLDMVMYINSINTYKLLGIPALSKVFKCVLTKDNHPSASIFKVPDKEYYLYKRFGEQGFVLNNMKILALLLNMEENKVVDFMKEPLNMQITYPDYIIEIQQKKDALLTHLKKEDLKITYPNTYKILHKHISLIEDILNVLSVSTYKDKRKIRLLSAKSTRSWTECLYGSSKFQNKIDKLNKLFNLLVYLNILNKPNKNQIPKELFKHLNTFKNNHQYKNFSSVFELKLLDTEFNFYTHLEDSCKLLIENNFSFRAFNQDFLNLIDSINKGNEIFIQSQNKPLNELTKRLIKDITEIIETELSINNFILVSNIKKILKANYNYSQNSLDNRFNFSLSICLDKLNLKKEKVSNRIKEENNLLDTIKGFPLIILK